MMNKLFQKWFLTLAVAILWLPAQQVSGATITNTARLAYTTGSSTQPVFLDSNTVTQVAASAPTPAVVTFHAFAPNAADSVNTAIDGGQCADANGSFSSIPTPRRSNGDSLPTSPSLQIRPVDVFHAGEPVFIQLADGNRDIDSAVRDIIDVIVTTSAGDEEILKLQETTINSGVFATVIQSQISPPAAIKNNCVLSVVNDGTIGVRYVDSFFPDDITQASVLVDPYGVLFNSRTGQGISGVRITLINVATGQPAQVFGDDGVSAYPSSMITGESVTDAAGVVYTFPPGAYRFPFVAPGQYRLQVEVPTGFTIPSELPLEQLRALRDSLGNPYALTLGSFGEVFTITAGSPALNIDIPADPPVLANPGQSLVLTKTASKPEASAGDFVQYTVSVRNSAGSAAPNTIIRDVLPIGFRYRQGSARRDDLTPIEPSVSADGRTLTFSLGNLAANASTRVSYVTELSAGVRPGEAVNLAAASAGTSITSNQARAMVQVREVFFGNCGIVVGRVVEGECSADWNSLKGVANARVMLEDGTYTTTDRDGMYHFERVCDGTHVVQLDLETLNSELEASPCIQNTRFAGRSFSQFVDVRGGGLWRADFWTQRKPPVQGPVGIRLSGTLVPGAAAPMPQRHTLNLNFDTRKAGLNATVQSQLDALLAQFKGMEVAGLTVVGHTDNVRIAPENRHEFADNQALSEARARTAAGYLQQQLGLTSSVVRSEGRAEFQPIAANTTAEGRAKNRRVEIIVQPRGNASAPAEISYRVELDGGKVPVNGLKAMVMLPEGVVPKSGTASLDGKPLAELGMMDGTATIAIGDVGANWKRVLEFKANAPAGACTGLGFEAKAMALFSTTLDDKGRTPAVAATLPCVAAQQANAQTLSHVVHFDSRKTAIKPADAAALDAMAAAARGKTLQSLSITGHADGQRIAPENRREFDNNQILSDARVESVKQYLQGRMPLDGALINLKGESNLMPVATNSTPEGMAQNRRAEVVMSTATEGVAPQPVSAASDYASTLIKGKDESAKKKTLMDLSDRRRERMAILEDGVAAGGKTDWLSNQLPGSAILFPNAGHNPRSNTQRLVVKHNPRYKVRPYINGKAIERLSYDGTQTTADNSVAVSVWTGVPLKEGDNELVAEEVDANGKVVNAMRQNVYFANSPAKAEIIAEQSITVADGVTTPVIAVRITDAQGKPVRAGVTGPFRIDPPYVPAELIRRQQQRQLAGTDSFTPTYQVEGDNGIAYIELQPTTQSGYAEVHMSFQHDQGQVRKQDLRAWMSSEARDWVVVGFAEGTVGYNTLSNKAQALASGQEDKLYNDGQIAFYAKGRIKGEWLATLAYDTRKNAPGLRNESLAQVIDPNEYYLLYGDGTEQRYDAPSQKRLFLKLERGRFFALFGDYETGLTQTQLSRYSRALNGIKSEYAGERFAYTVFGADTKQNFIREEIQGNGTSGLYRLSQTRIVINSERISLVTKDRLKSEVLVNAQSLFRHIDYDIDYSNGTIFFKSPVFARDGDFNPTFILAEYETAASTEKNLNGGGRGSVTLMDGKLTVGGSYLRDERDNAKTDLAGIDAKLRLGVDTEVRLEAARSKSTDGSSSETGVAWLAEVEHHNKGADVLAYARRQDADFGVNQQSGFESGTQKLGVTARVPLSQKLSVNADVYRQENLTSDAVRDAASARLEMKTSDTGRVFVGGQLAKDEDGSGNEAKSNLLNVGASERFLNNKLELSGRSDFAVGGKDDSIDFPTRHVVQAGYDVTAATKLIVAQEFTEGSSYDSATTRIGAISNPWKGAKLNSTLNQSMGEYGPRTFAQYGLAQSFLFGEGWGVDFGVDRSDTFKESNQQPVVVNGNGFPLAAGGVTGGGNFAGGTGAGFVQSNTEDYTALTAGLTYRADTWSGAARAETRMGEREDRRSLSISALRQAQAGIAFAASARIFDGSNSAGTDGQSGNASLSLAWRPLGSRWSVLQRLEYRHDSVSAGTGIPGGGLFGNNSLNVSGNAKSRAIINHLSFNRVSKRWNAQDRQGNLFALNQRTQFGVFYGAKYSFDEYNGQAFTGFTDMLGLELRHDLSTTVDLGLQASVLHNWEAKNYSYSVGPMVGLSPFENLWLSLGYNIVGFEDEDFEDSAYTAQGPYLKARFKFDQLTRFGEAAQSPQALTPEQLAKQRQQ